ncbi:MAG: hypothetical protein Q8Q60_03285 [Candidatus Chromulinivorax sp.]|nr:hypothetical protein [Candidatus Chromulinivorax sp.]
MNFLRKISYSFPYKGAYGKRKKQHPETGIAQRGQSEIAKRDPIFYYMVIYFDIITFIRGNHYANN